MRLAGKVALISGGARGMRAAETRFFAREGAGVVIGDIFENEGREVEADVRASASSYLGTGLRSCARTSAIFSAAAHAQRAVDFLHSRPARQAATLQPALDTAEGAP